MLLQTIVFVKHSLKNVSNIFCKNRPINDECFHMLCQLSIYCQYQREVGILVALQENITKIRPIK